MQPTLEFLKILAKQAGVILKNSFGQQLEVKYKGLINLVTQVDHQSEDFILAQIREHFPGDSIITEESGHLAGVQERCWYVDPLDGTLNYAHGLPIFTVSIAYAENGQLTLGVVYDPMQDECFSAERGKGAWLNDRPIHVSDTPDLIHSLLVTGFPYEISSVDDSNLAHYARLSIMTQGVRRLGSAAMDLSYVACGRLDGFWEVVLSAWDVAAGALIVQEAGGLVTDFTGTEDFMKEPFSIIAATPTIYAPLLEALHMD